MQSITNSTSTASALPLEGFTHRYRDALLAQARQQHYTHWVTLNTHRDCSLEIAMKYLKRWRVEVLRRLHGRKFYDLPHEQVMHYFGCPELSLAKHPHFHLACFVPDGLHEKFEQVAALRWLDIIPSGTHYIRLIGATDEDQKAVLNYATKRLNPLSPVPFVDSRVYQ
ncbi:MAG: hypothetical protein KGM99_04730 [Burkholderiales bacterium]|nr:hypothetical protein [Burkholderiales bacterium]